MEGEKDMKIEGSEEVVSDGFIQELLTLKQQEEKEGESVHLKDVEISANVLESEDEEMWKKIKEGNLTWQEFKEYQVKTMEDLQELKKTDPGAAKNRSEILAFFGNLAVGAIYRKQAKEEKQ